MKFFRMRVSGGLLPVSHLLQPKANEAVENISVRFRTVGDITCTAAVASTAGDVQAVIAEIVDTELTERGATRLDDQTHESSMELRKKEGYF